jgi:hypothetical protein
MRVGQLEDIIKKLVSENDRLNTILGTQPSSITMASHISPMPEPHAAYHQQQHHHHHQHAGNDSVAALLQSAHGNDPALTQQLLAAIINQHNMPM